MNCFVCHHHHRQPARESILPLDSDENQMYLLPCGDTAHLFCLHKKSVATGDSIKINCCDELYESAEWMKVRIDRDQLQQIQYKISDLNKQIAHLQREEAFIGLGDYAAQLMETSPVWIPPSDHHCLNCFAPHDLEFCDEDFFIREDVRTFETVDELVTYTTRIKRGTEGGAGYAFNKLLANYNLLRGVALREMSRDFKKLAFTALVGIAFWKKICSYCGCPFHQRGVEGSRECRDRTLLTEAETESWEQLLLFLLECYGPGTQRNPKKEMGFTDDDIRGNH